MSILNLFKSKDPGTLKFYKGQKVFCAVTHEVDGSKIGPGVIIKYKFKKHSYWAFSDIPSNWYLVKYADGTKIVLPEERIYDLKEHTERWEMMLEKNKDRIGEPGYSVESAKKMMALTKESRSLL